MAKYDKTGAEVDPVFPFSLRFEPSQDLQWSEDWTEDIIKQLTTIPVGQTVWTIYGLDAPTELGGTEHKIGTLVTTSESVTSNYSDDMMLFRHQRAEDDIKVKPEWTDYYPKYVPLENYGEYQEGDCGISADQPMKPTCPFAFLMN